jgi:hypothetical protein
MANSPNPDFVPEIMQKDHGTMVLITNLGAEKYLKLARKAKIDPPNDRLSRPCGGKGGFDDYVEWFV